MVTGVQYEVGVADEQDDGDADDDEGEEGSKKETAGHHDLGDEEDNKKTYDGVVHGSDIAIQLT